MLTCSSGLISLQLEAGGASLPAFSPSPGVILPTKTSQSDLDAVKRFWHVGGIVEAQQVHASEDLPDVHRLPTGGLRSVGLS